MVDSHVHLFMSGTPDPETRQRQLAQPYKELKAVMARHLLGHFRHGVLAVRDGGDYGGYSLRYRNECSGDFPPVRVRAPGKAWRAAKRYGSLIGRPPPGDRTLEEALGDALDRQGSDRPDHVKIVQSGLNSLLRFGKETPPQFSPDALKAAVKTADRFGLRTMVHANGRTPVQQTLEAGCHSVEHGFFMGRENLERMADLPVIWVPTVFTMKAYAASLEQGSRRSDTARKTLDHQLEQLSRARGLGIATAAGTDCGSLGVHHGKAMKEEIRLFMQAGYTLEEALCCATGNGARLLGLQEELGVIAPGMPATFLVVTGGLRDLPGGLDHLEGVYLRGRKLPRLDSELE
jgi:imidazolonepropionase-like amidohydrolase